jgi:hypothetical protein
MSRILNTNHPPPDASDNMTTPRRGRGFQSVITHASVVELVVEANDIHYWANIYGSERAFYRYDRSRKIWQKCTETGGYVYGGMGAWQCDERTGEPYLDGGYRDCLFFDVANLIRRLSESVTSAAERRRLGSYQFIASVMKWLENDERMTLQSRDFGRKLPMSE